MNKISKLILICIIFQLLNNDSLAQGSVWNSNSLKFSKDTVSFESMAGATNVNFAGTPVSSSSSISFGGSSFRYGLSSYNNFYISPYGFIKFGNNIISNNPEQDSNVIAPLYNGTPWDASYKSVGVAPNRKMIIQYTGVMQPSGEPTSFQIWLYERTGRIDFVYEKLRGFYSSPNSYYYRIFCSSNINHNYTVESLQTKSNNNNPTISNVAILSGFDSIYAKTRYTFQPDTIKPAAPGQLTFTNVQPGCLTVNFSENSNNESQIVIENAIDSINYFLKKNYFVTNPIGSNNYNFNETGLQPSWNYTYRIFVSNGFLNSDTISNTVKTLAPQINGIKKIPGDYPTITALLADASCKQLGPNLIIELQNNYSFASEILPISFGNKLQNRLIESIVIRPAANAVINWTGSTRTALFYVDSVKHLFIDGRSGGVGTAQNFTIFQQNPLSLAIQYTNLADSGGIRFCKILKKNSNSSNTSIAVYPLDSSASYPKKTVNNFTLANNIISTDSASVLTQLYFKSNDSLGCQNFIITGNQFSRFYGDAIIFENGGANSIISDNSFYQPIPITPLAFLPINTASCVKLLNTETITVKNNYFGGGSSIWGKGSFIINDNANEFHFIHYQNTSNVKKAYFTNNKFGNIKSLGSVVKMIYASNGDVTIDGNQIGTSDSTNSITNSKYFSAFDLWLGNKYITNNFFSGFQGQYPNGNEDDYSYFIAHSSVDSIYFYKNDFGGSNNPDANRSYGNISGIVSYASKNVEMRQNIFRGMYSTHNNLTVIDYNNTDMDQLWVDSNNFHHLKAGNYVTGIKGRLYPYYNTNISQICRISDNNMYALQTTGVANGGYGPEGNIYGMLITLINRNTNKINGSLKLSGNKLNSFSPVKLLTNSTYGIYGINISADVCKIWNNELRFGLNTKGQNIDTTQTGAMSLISSGGNINEVEHNSLYVGGVGYSSTGITVNAPTLAQSTNAFVTNNIIQIDRLNINPPDPNKYQIVTGYLPISAKNLWYSTNEYNIDSLLSDYKQNCHCDSSSFVGNPKFINTKGDSSNYNLHLNTGSLADSTGTPSIINIPTDLDGLNRNHYSPVDIGCYAATPCGTGIFPNINITSPTADTVQLCGNLILTASITNGAFSKLQWQHDFIDSVGANTTTLNINSPGSYRLVGKTDCGTVASRVIFVVGNALQPHVTISTSANSFCEGIPVTFTATSSNEGMSPSYQWQVNGMNAGTNNNIFSTNSLKNNDEVKAILTNSSSCGTPVSITSNVIIITVISAPVAHAGKDTTICAGSSLQLNGTGGNTYLWSPAGSLSNPNIANPIATPNNTTEYILTVTNSANCFSKDTVVISVNQLVSPTVNITTTNNNICIDAEVLFISTATNTGTSPVYQWQINGINAGTNKNTFLASGLNNNDQVRTILSSSLACASPKTVTSNIISINVQTLDIPIVTLSDHLFTVTNPQSGILYTWQQLINNNWADILPTVVGTTFNSLSPGEFRVKASNGVCTDYSNSQINSLRPANNSFGIYLYPNPANQFITIDSLQLLTNWETLDIVDALGKHVLPIINIQNKTHITVDINYLIPGVYIAILRKKDGVFFTLKFEKQ